jgi:hypothetical protein
MHDVREDAERMRLRLSIRRTRMIITDIIPAVIGWQLVLSA